MVKSYPAIGLNHEVLTALHETLATAKTKPQEADSLNSHKDECDSRDEYEDRLRRKQD
jgi:hypothetical protein